jgi:hypothetical protein
MRIEPESGFSATKNPGMAGADLLNTPGDAQQNIRVD